MSLKDKFHDWYDQADFPEIVLTVSFAALVIISTIIVIMAFIGVIYGL